MKEDEAIDTPFDLLVVGAGAAGHWAARAAAGHDRELRAKAGTPSERPLRIGLLDSRSRVGAKILMSGGTRCNLTHVEVRPEDYRGGNHHRIARILRAHSPAESLRIFREELGVDVYTEESTGKLFPADDRAATVLAALRRACDEAGVPLLSGQRWTALEIAADSAAAPAPRWSVGIVDPAGNPLPPITARRLLVCTGGRSYPKTGSDGGAWEILRGLGHTIVTPVPALTPFVLGACFHQHLSGIAHPARLTLRVDGRDEAMADGPLLWTHFGVSGPAALDLSGHWARLRADRPAARLEVFLSFRPGESIESLDAAWLAAARRHPTRTLRGFLDDLPHRLVDALAGDAGADPQVSLAQTSRERRRALIERIARFPLPVSGVRGFGQAEVTSGGVPLEEVDRGLESRILPGVHFAGEVLHVDGRLGGFNFQWAWSSATVAAETAVDRLRSGIAQAGSSQTGTARDGSTEGGGEGIEMNPSPEDEG